MSDIDAEIGRKLVRRFFSQIYDEWITGINRSEVPGVDACTCRALNAAIGNELFDSILKSLVADQRIEFLGRFEKAEPDAIIVKLLDYCV